MKGLVLCGGKGTRLRPLTYTFPKQLIPVANRPILAYVFDHLANAGIKDIGVIISPQTGTAVKNFLGTGSRWGVRPSFIIQEEPLGIAHAVKIARDFLGDEPFIMYLGDNLLQDDLGPALSRFAAEELDALVMLKRVPNPGAFGVALLSETGTIIRLMEKPPQPPSDLALVGVYLFSPKIHPVINTLTPSTRGELEITDAIQGLIDLGARVKPLLLEGWWLDTGKKDDLLSANRIVLETYAERRIAGNIGTATIIGRVTIATGTRVHNSTIEGPSVIGENAVIEDSFIGPGTSIGAGCYIIGSRVERSVILENSRIENIGPLTESLIGQEVRIRGSGPLAHPVRLLLSDNSEVEI